MRLQLIAAAGAVLAASPGAAAAATGPELWGQAGCGGCHTLQAAGGGRPGRPEPRLPAPLERRRRGAGRERRRRDAVVRLVAHVVGDPDARKLGLDGRRRAGRVPAASAPASGMSAAAVKRLQATSAKLRLLQGPDHRLLRPAHHRSREAVPARLGPACRRDLGAEEHRGDEAAARMTALLSKLLARPHLFLIDRRQLPV